MPAITNSERSIKRFAQPWTDDWIAALSHPKRGRCERVFNDPTLSGHRLIVKRNKKVFEVRQTFVVRVADAVLERARKERGEIMSVVEEARRRAVALLANIQSATALTNHITPSGTVPVTLSRAWARFKERKDLGPRTRKLYNGVYRTHLEGWGEMTLRSLLMAPTMVRDKHNEISQRGPDAADRAMKLLRTIYNHAARFDFDLPRDRNPCEAVEWHGDQKREGAVIPANMMPRWKRQVEAISIRNRIHAGFHMLCLRLGAQPGDLARARWRDVDWKRRVMAMPDTKSKPYEIPLTPQSLKELRMLRAVPAPNKDLAVDFIFPSPHIGKNDGRFVSWLEPKVVLSHSGNCGRHTHHTIGVALEINELILDVLEGRSIMKAGLPGRNYVDRGELGRTLRKAQEKINREIDRMFAG